MNQLNQVKNGFIPYELGERTLERYSSIDENDRMTDGTPNTRQKSHDISCYTFDPVQVNKAVRYKVAVTNEFF